MKKILTFLIMLCAAVSTASAETMYIVGDAPFGGWQTNAGQLMTDNGDGTFSFEYTPESNATIWFCISPSLAASSEDWGTFNSVCYRPSSSSKISNFIPIQLATDQNSNNSVGIDLTASVKYTFLFYKESKEILVYTETPDLYLRSNLDANDGNSWKTWKAAFSELTDYKFEKSSFNSQYKKIEYTYNVTSTQLAAMVASGQNDLYFRVQNDDNNMPQMCPESDKTFTFDDGKNSDNYEGYSDNGSYTYNEVSHDTKFVVAHSSEKASEYKIIVWVEFNYWGRKYTTSVEVVTTPVTITAGKATFSSTRAVNFWNTGISAYAITGASNGELTKSNALTEVPANTGLYLEAENNTYEIPVITTQATIGTNMLVAVPSENTNIKQTDGANTNFILTVNTVNGNVDTPKFYKVNADGNTVLANRAYLQIPTANAAREYFWFNDEATAIDAVKQKQSFDGEAYNLAGQRIAQPVKGLYIVNGRKVVIK